ncbi:Carbonic anhydrase 6, partial [Caligus rogercresseyi]
YDIYDTPLDFVMKNDGNTVKAYLKDNKDIPSIIFAGYQYKFSHFLFHWGGDNTVGSEHLLDGIAAPLEVQLVHFNSMNAKTFEEALAKKETILVLGALFDIIPCSVTAFEPLINTLEDVVSPGSEAEVTGLKLEDLLPTDKNTFFAYLGSLTMPRCEEGVLWFVFKVRQCIIFTTKKKYLIAIYIFSKKATFLKNNWKSSGDSRIHKGRQ